MSAPNWEEVYDGGSPEAETAIFLELADQMLAIQEANRQKAGRDHADRTLHAKMTVGVTDAVLSVDATIPDAFRTAHFEPGARLRTAVRFSNASALAQADTSPDMRGAALKIWLGADAEDVPWDEVIRAQPEQHTHDLLMTSYPVSHARNARQFVDFAVAAQGPRETLVERLVAKFGQSETQRMLANIQQGARSCESLALQRFWSRGAVLWGTQPVRFDLRPIDAAPAATRAFDGPDALRDEFAERLRACDVRFRLAVQPFVDLTRTPIEDAAVAWSEDASAPVEIATLTIARRSLESADAKRQADTVAAMAFNPWHAPAACRPLGNLNRVRGVVYGKSAQRWQRGG
ncbi:hypothetical protein [Pararobbsia silviterrae]|nr:hypothetical protein [Pararobbsia silviterrae]